ncbi:hypothetical protein FQZ97_936460 [compost metagenome]
MAVGEFTGQAIGVLHQVHDFKPVEGRIQQLAFSAAVTGGVQNPRDQIAIGQGVLSDQEVFQHGHFLEQANVLESPGQARTIYLMGSAEHLVPKPGAEPCRIDEVLRSELFPEHFDHVCSLALSIEQDLSARRLVEPGKAVEDRGLAGSVRSDQSRNRVALNAEINVVERLDAAEVHHQLVDRENDIAHGATPLRGAIPMRLMRISPRGFQIIITTMRTPKSRTR